MIMMIIYNGYVLRYVDAMSVVMVVVTMMTRPKPLHDHHEIPFECWPIGVQAIDTAFRESLVRPINTSECLPPRMLRKHRSLTSTS